MKNHILIGNLLLVANFFEYFDVIFDSSCFSINEPWEKLLGILREVMKGIFLSWLVSPQNFQKRPLEDFVDLKVAGMVVGLLEYVEVHLMVEVVVE